MRAKTTSRHHNVDEQEIAKFEAVASRWWDLEGEFKSLSTVLIPCASTISCSAQAVF